MISLGGITQEEMARKLIQNGAEPTVHSGYIADYEKNGPREPSLLTLLAYSKITGLSVNLFIDDALDLPAPSKKKVNKS